MKETITTTKYKCDFCHKYFEKGFHLQRMAIETLPYDCESWLDAKDYCSRECFSDHIISHTENQEWVSCWPDEEMVIVPVPENWK